MVHSWSSLVLFAGAVLLVRRWVRAARRDGLFAPGVATRLRAVGHFLVVGTLLMTVLRMVGDEVIIAHTAVDPVQTWWLPDLQEVPWLLILVGIGVTSLARVMAYARLLQDDVDGLV